MGQTLRGKVTQLRQASDVCSGPGPAEAPPPTRPPCPLRRRSGARRPQRARRDLSASKLSTSSRWTLWPPTDVALWAVPGQT